MHFSTVVLKDPTYLSPIVLRAHYLQVGPSLIYQLTFNYLKLSVYGMKLTKSIQTSLFVSEKILYKFFVGEKAFQNGADQFLTRARMDSTAFLSVYPHSIRPLFFEACLNGSLSLLTWILKEQSRNLAFRISFIHVGKSLFVQVLNKLE